MDKYRKKPIEVEAIQYTPMSREACIRFSDAVGHTAIDEEGEEYEILNLKIETLEGTMRCKVGDWIIRGVEGEIYPCKNSIFQKTYEVIE